MNVSNTLHELSHKIDEQLYQLQVLAKAFGVVGNETVSNDLYFIAKDIRAYVKEMNRTVNDDLNNQVNVSMKSMGETLSAFANAMEKKNERGSN